MRAVSGTLFDQPDGQQLRARIRRIVSRLAQIAAVDEKVDALADFPAPQRSIIKQIIEAIHVIGGETEEADRLVGKILSRLRKQRSSRATR